MHDTKYFYAETTPYTIDLKKNSYLHILMRDNFPTFPKLLFLNLKFMVAQDRYIKRTRNLITCTMCTEFHIIQQIDVNLERHTSQLLAHKVYIFWHFPVINIFEQSRGSINIFLVIIRCEQVSRILGVWVSVL
jgi:hypothetical protein